MGLEKQFEQRLKNFLSTIGIYALGTEKQKMLVKPIGYYEKRFANRNTKKGLPDMHICICGVSLEVELKAENGTPSNLQIKMCKQIRESGGHAYIVYPSGFEELKQIISDIVMGELDGEWPLILR